ncbi:hypothetical protein D3C81_2283710 [compost metagenome]
MKVKKAMATMRNVSVNVPICAPSGAVCEVGDMWGKEMPGRTAARVYPMIA